MAAMSDERQQQSVEQAAARTSLRERLQALATIPRRALAAARRKPLRAAAIGGGGLAIAAAVAFAAVTIVSWRRASAEASSLDKALAKLDAGQYQQARDIAAELLGSTSLAYDELGGPAYVLGAALAHSAEDHWNEAERRSLYLIAARYLEEARDRRFPRGREASGLYLLGRSLFESGRYAQSLAPLLAAAEANPQRRTEIYGLLAAAYRRDSDPQLELALQYCGKYLEDRMLAPEQRRDGFLQLAEIHFDKGDSDACRATLP